MTKMFKVFLLLMLAVSLSAGSPLAGIGLNPAVTEIVIPAGVPSEGRVAVKNSFNEEIAFEVQTENWLRRRGVETPGAEIEPEDWLSVETPVFSIRPGEIKDVRYTATIPEGTEGELVAMLFFAPAPEEGGISVRSRFGAIIYAAAEGTLDVSCKAESLRYTGSGLRVTVRNTGNVHLRPDGKVIVTNPQGDVSTFSLQSGWSLFPGQARHFTAVTEEELPEGEYTAQAVIEYGMLYGEKRITESPAEVFSK